MAGLVLALSPLGASAGPQGVRAAFVTAIVGGLVAAWVGGVEEYSTTEGRIAGMRAALAPFAAQALADRGGTAYVGLFLTVAGALTFAGVKLGRGRV